MKFCEEMISLDSGCGQVVRVPAFNFDDSSSNPAEVYDFL